MLAASRLLGQSDKTVNDRTLITAASRVFMSRSSHL
jgi:hypothetical protein